MNAYLVEEEALVNSSALIPTGHIIVRVGLVTCSLNSTVLVRDFAGIEACT